MNIMKIRLFGMHDRFYFYAYLLQFVWNKLCVSDVFTKFSFQVIICDNTLRENDSFDEDILSYASDFRFDSEKCVCTSVKDNHTLVHSSGGRGYGMLINGVSRGCYKWKVSGYC